jgi:hypothetical protein
MTFKTVFPIVTLKAVGLEVDSITKEVGRGLEAQNPPTFPPLHAKNPTAGYQKFRRDECRRIGK